MVLAFFSLGANDRSSDQQITDQQISDQEVAGQQSAGSDLSDALLLHDSRRAQLAELGFRKVVDFYGLTRADHDLAAIALTDALLRDEAGSYYPTVYIAGPTLDSALDAEELGVLKAAIEQGGVNLMVGTFQAEHSAALEMLTDSAIVGSTLIAGAKAYRVSEAWPEVTQELTGVTVVHEAERGDYALRVASDRASAEVFVEIIDDGQRRHPLFARHRLGKGAVFVSGENPDYFLREYALFENYYLIKPSNGAFKTEHFAQIVPTMMFVRYTAGEEAWHTDRHYANLTIDDPALRSSHLDYAAILREAKSHNFHLTIAMPPAEYDGTEPEIAALFRDNPDRLSIVQHGNDHDGFEFYRYTTEPSDEFPARPLEEQEADIVEGRTRLEAHLRLTGVPYGKIMVFPFGIAPAPTLSLLKQYNFQATINSLDVPLDETRTKGGNAHMYPAELSYRNFATILRYHPPNVPSPFELFIGKPLFIYDHKDLFRAGPTGFNAYADAINKLHAKVEWQSLDYIMKHLYLEKRNDDGTWDAMFFGNDIVLTNTSAGSRVYHVKRAETQEVPVAGVTLDGKTVDYYVAGGTLQVDVAVPARASRQLRIRYAPPNRDFAIESSSVALDPATGIITATVRNLGATGGPVTVGFFERSPVDDATPMALAIAGRVEPGESAVVTATLQTVPRSGVIVALDPYDVIGEADESNNVVRLNLP